MFLDSLNLSSPLSLVSPLKTKSHLGLFVNRCFWEKSCRVSYFGSLIHEGQKQFSSRNHLLVRNVFKSYFPNEEFFGFPYTKVMGKISSACFHTEMSMGPC